MTPKQMVSLLDKQLVDAYEAIDALKAELERAVETAFNRGAVEWTASNHPKTYEKLRSKL